MGGWGEVFRRRWGTHFNRFRGKNGENRVRSQLSKHRSKRVNDRLLGWAL